MRRIIVNLAPADIPKFGPSCDLPIALGILIGSQQISPNVEDAMFFGELSLDGSLRHTNGILPMAHLAKTQKNITRIFVSNVNAKEAAIVNDVSVYPVKSLLKLARHLSGTIEIQPEKPVKMSKILKTAEAELIFQK